MLFWQDAVKTGFAHGLGEETGARGWGGARKGHTHFHTHTDTQTYTHRSFTRKTLRIGVSGVMVVVRA